MLLAIPLRAQEISRTFRVPFHSVNGMILLDATANGQGVTLLLDSWADNSIVSPSIAGVSAKLDVLKPEKTTGASGDYTKAQF